MCKITTKTATESHPDTIWLQQIMGHLDHVCEYKMSSKILIVYLKQANTDKMQIRNAGKSTPENQQE